MVFPAPAGVLQPNFEKSNFEKSNFENQTWTREGVPEASWRYCRVRETEKERESEGVSERGRESKRGWERQRGRVRLRGIEGGECER